LKNYSKSLGILLLLAAFAILLHGYHPGVEDDGVYLPAIKRHLNPQLYPHDAGLNLYQFPQLAVSLELVKSYFARYGLLDAQVQFLQGWFRDTLPTAPVQQLALLRVDGDMYESTTDVLKNLYSKVVSGGFVIIDDYQDIPACRQAVEDYRHAHQIAEPIIPIDWTGVYWRKG